MKKRCSKCDIVKDTKEFYSFLALGRPYVRPDCKNCFNRMADTNKRSKQYQELVTGLRDVVKKRRAYYKKNRDRILAQRRKRKEHREFSHKTESALKEADLKEYIGET